MTTAPFKPPYYPPGIPWPPPGTPGGQQGGPPVPGAPGGTPSPENKEEKPPDTTVGKTGKTPAGAVLSVEKTTGEDKYIVRTQIPGADPGIYKQTIMSGAEVKAAGGEIPLSGTWGQGAGTKWASPDTPTKESEARREAHKYDIPDELKDYPQNVKDAYVKAVKDGTDANDAVNDAIKTYNDYLKRTGESRLAAYNKSEREEKQFREELRKDDPYLYQIYTEKGAEAYNEAVKKREEDIGGIEKRWVEKLRKDDPYLYQKYKEGGIEAYNKAVNKRTADLAGIQERNYITIGDSMMKKADWVKLEQKYKDIATSQGFDAMDNAIQKDIDDYNKAIDSLRNYLIKAEPSGASEKATPKKEVMGLEPAPGETYDIVKFLKENPGREDVLRTAGYKEDAIKDASYFSKKNAAQLMWDSMTPWKEERGEKATFKGGAVMAAEVLVPGVYVGRHWNEMSAAERAFAIGIDVLTLAMWAVPAVGVAGKAARTVGYASAGARFGAAAKAVAGYTARQLAPVDAIIHPVATGKAAAKEIRNLFEVMTNPRRISEPVITTSSGQVMFRVSDFSGSARRATQASDALMKQLAKGDQLFVKVGDTSVELRQSALMEKAGGGASHATPDLTDFEKGLLVEWQGGKSIKEQGLFMANEPVTQYVPAGAAGKGAIPIATEAGGKAEKVWYYKPADIARMDADAVRPLTFAYAKGIPVKAAPILERIAKKYNAKVAGSLNSYIKVPKAPRPNDIDLIMKNPSIANKAKKEAIDELRKAGFTVTEHPTKRILNINGKEAVDFWTETPYNKTIGNEYVQPTREIDGFNVQYLGENYVHQAYGSVTATSKTGKRIKSINIISDRMLKLLKNDGANVRKPGVIITSEKTAEKGTPTDKLFYSYEEGQGWVKEAESKLFTGEKTGEVGQRLWFRTGPRGIRAELWLEKPLKLSKTDILKLKAAGIIEDIKAPFRTAIKVSKGEAGRATTQTAGRGLGAAAYTIRVAGLTAEQTRIFSRFLERDGYITRRQAGNMLRAERILRNTETTRVPARVTRSKIAERIIRVNRATPERLEPIRGRVPERITRTPPPRVPPPREPPPRTFPPREEPPREFPPREPPPRTYPPREYLPERFKPRSRILPPSTSQKDAEKQIKAAGGAIAWRMGKVGKRERWDVVINPYQDNSNYLMVMGRAPRGATIIERGKGSAYATAQMLRGAPPKKPFDVDSGFMDIGVSATGRKINATFKPDPLGKTTGDITIGQPRISEPSPRISSKFPRISGRTPRISKPFPKLR